MTTICLLGTGLMGGSIGLALRKREIPVRVQAYARRAETRKELLDREVADEVFDDPAKAVEGADLVVLCVPVCGIPDLLAAAKPGLTSDAVVTDVGSTKAWLAARCEKILEDSPVPFIGSHPMCGSEKTGLDSADADLYQGATCIVTGTPETRAHVYQVTQFWTRIGSRVVEMSPEEHDRLVAYSSHVPHLAASALVTATGAFPDSFREVIGSGFRDTTRVAEGSPVLWRDIVSTNSAPVLEGLRELIGSLGELERLIADENHAGVEAYLRRAAERRSLLCSPHPNPEANQTVIAIDGPSASGKSTVARSVAEALNYFYVDSGAVYRGLTWQVLREECDPEEEAEVMEVLNRSQWAFAPEERIIRFKINGTDPGEEIRGEAVRENVSYVARIPAVRQFINSRIRDLRSLGPLVVEGRDIGSVVFPETPLKFYLDADPVERARRRSLELSATEGPNSVEAVQASLSKRDHLDSTRKTAPLQIAEGAEVVDSTALNLDEVIQKILSLIAARD